MTVLSVETEGYLAACAQKKRWHVVMLKYFINFKWKDLVCNKFLIGYSNMTLCYLSLSLSSLMLINWKWSIRTGNPSLKGEGPTVDLLHKIACFYKKVKNVFNVFNIKSSWSELVTTWRSTVLILPFQWGLPGQVVFVFTHSQRAESI